MWCVFVHKQTNILSYAHTHIWGYLVWAHLNGMWTKRAPNTLKLVHSQIKWKQRNYTIAITFRSVSICLCIASLNSSTTSSHNFALCLCADCVAVWLCACTQWTYIHTAGLSLSISFTQRQMYNSCTHIHHNKSTNRQTYRKHHSDKRVAKEIHNNSWIFVCLHSIWIEDFPNLNLLLSTIWSQNSNFCQK